MSQQHRESWVDRQIREAQERGEFDNLPGAGKPLGDLGDPNDPDWWVRNYIKREKLDISGALPTPLALRKEAASFPESLADVRTEVQVREILEDFNHRVKIDRLRPAVGNLPPLLARTVDVDEVVEQWRELRATMAPPLPTPPVTEEPPPTAARGWWRRLFGG
jgi:DnaJ homologue, subfamily C, member 28, conserved domain